MDSELIVDLETLAASVPDGAVLAVPKDSSGVAMAATRELVRRGVRALHLVCVPTGGIQADILIGCGAVKTLETSAVTLGEYGGGPRFADAIARSAIDMRDATCPAVYAALQAGEKGLPFMPLRGMLGSDLLSQRKDWKVIDNPFAENDPIVALPAIRPDIALFHAPLADRFGNVFIGRQRELVTMAHASRQTLVTVEDFIDEDLLEDGARSGSVLPAIYVTQIARAPRGAWPLAFSDLYSDDETELLRYVSAARTQDGFAQYVAGWLQAHKVAA